MIARAPLSKSSSFRLGIPFINLAYNKPLYRFAVILKIMIRSQFRKKSSNSAGKEGFMTPDRDDLKNNTMDKLPLINVPTLVITGSKDRVVKPNSSEVIAKLIPNAKLVVIKNGSHFFHAEMKKAFNQEVLNFLMH